MKLFCTPNSPFSRIVRVVVQELELSERVEIEFVTVRDDKSELLQYNATGKVPSLLLNDQQLLSETYKICQYLVSISKGNNFMASLSNMELFALEGLSIGLVESVAVWIREDRRPEHLVNSDVIDLEKKRVTRIIKQLSPQVCELPSHDQPQTLTNLCLFCAIDLLDRRIDFNWQDINQEFTSWFENLKDRPSLINTSPLQL